MNNDIGFFIAFALVFAGCMLYFNAMISLIISRTISHHTDKASMDWWGLKLGAMKCIIKNPYKKDKKIDEYARKARIALAIMAAAIVLVFVLSL